MAGFQSLPPAAHTVYTHTGTHSYTRMCTHTHSLEQAHTPTHINKGTDTYTHARTYTDRVCHPLHTHIQTRRHTSTHTEEQTHTHTHTHTQFPPGVFLTLTFCNIGDVPRVSETKEKHLCVNTA